VLGRVAAKPLLTCIASLNVTRFTQTFPHISTNHHDGKIRDLARP
jgi:hypothetical protein